jgi:hypothetical protein
MSSSFAHTPARCAGFAVSRRAVASDIIIIAIAT